ncbi:MAG TPA: quaternary ammonium compound efflux SMR transporter SugE [Gemmataceae bacterium]|nr:quaternary ammonium compound efflux SMR transporter SugE [Gemmataceae bacterium]
MNHYWIMLLIAAGLEIVWAVGLKYTEGFTRFWPSIGTVLAMAASMYLLARSAEGLPIGTAYAVWTGIGAVGTAVVGMVWLNESRDWVRVVCIGLIVLGVVGLKVFTREGDATSAEEAASHPSEYADRGWKRPGSTAPSPGRATNGHGDRSLLWIHPGPARTGAVSLHRPRRRLGARPAAPGPNRLLR